MATTYRGADMTAARDQHGQFDARIADVELVRIVGRVALAARPDDPTSLSQPLFDRHVAAHRDQFPGVPTARAIYMRINSGTHGRVAWAQIVAAGITGEASARQTVVSGTRRTSPVPIDEHVITVALRTVAKHLTPRDGGIVREHRYDTIRDRLIGAGRTRNTTLEAILPTAAQIKQAAGSWPNAQRGAGLPTGQGEPPGAATAPSRAATAAKRRQIGMPVVDALVLFVDANGWLPGEHDLRTFMRRAGLALARVQSTPWPVWIQQLAERLAQDGRQLPPKPPRGRKPELVIPDHNLTEYVLRTAWTDLDTCAWKVVEFWDQLPRRQEPSRTRYGRWAVGKPVPSPRNFDRHGGWSAVLNRARELRDDRNRG